MKDKNKQSKLKINQQFLLIAASVFVCLLCFAIVLFKAVKYRNLQKYEFAGEESLSFENIDPNDNINSLKSQSMGEDEPDIKINLNTATAEDLKSLKGIGEVKAGAIIEHRRENGDFQSICELLEVKGIGEKTFENIKSFICV